MLPWRPYAGVRLAQAPSRGTLYEIRRGGRSENAIIVPTFNATATDVIGTGLAAALFFSTKSLLVKAVAVGGGLWMLGALVGKVVTLAKGPEGTAIIQEGP